MPKLDMDGHNVFEIDLSVAQARQLIDDVGGGNDVCDNLTDKLDEAQGHVGMGRDPVAYVIIKITA